jgi:hypothetical protein
MRDALQDTAASWYSRPKGVYAITIDRNTGLLPTRDCDNIMTEYFLEGTIPTEYSTDCGEGTGRDESFNIDIFNKKRDSSNFFGQPSGEGQPEVEEFDFNGDLGLEEEEIYLPDTDMYPEEIGSEDAYDTEGAPGSEDDNHTEGAPGTGIVPDTEVVSETKGSLETDVDVR